MRFAVTRATPKCHDCYRYSAHRKAKTKRYVTGRSEESKKKINIPLSGPCESADDAPASLMASILHLQPGDE
jgi:hypothetical protein